VTLARLQKLAKPGTQPVRLAQPLRLTRRAAAAALALPLLLSGCLVTRRKLPVPIAPAITQYATAAELVKQLNDRWSTLQTLNATVEMKATVTHSQKGESSEYPSIRGIILLKKPSLLRVYGRVPVVGTRLLDMTSDGKEFTLWIPSKNEAIEGPATESQTKSANQFENLRPAFFFDSLVVRGLDPGDEYIFTADTDTVEDASKKHLLIVPEYLLNIVHRKPDTGELAPVRVIHFHREDLLPHQQDLYDDQGNLRTQVFYGAYTTYGENRYPSTITIKRPVEELQISLTLEKLTENAPLKDEDFQFKSQMPPDTKIHHLNDHTPANSLH
jgi:outer membrane lipoprotein-sorting protein